MTHRTEFASPLLKAIAACSYDDLPAFAASIPPLSPERERRIAEIIAEHDDDPIAALGGEHLPEDVKAEIRCALGYAA